MDPDHSPTQGQHLRSEEIEEYLLARGGEQLSRRVESHASDCPSCRRRVLEERSLIARIRHVLGGVVWTKTHVTDEGPVRLFVLRTADEQYLGRVLGLGYDAGEYFPTSEEATRWTQEGFSAIFPEHSCSEQCR